MPAMKLPSSTWFSLFDYEFVNFISTLLPDASEQLPMGVAYACAWLNADLRAGHQFSRPAEHAGVLIAGEESPADGARFPAADEWLAQLLAFAGAHPEIMRAVSSRDIVSQEDAAQLRAPLLLVDGEALYLQRYYQSEWVIAAEIAKLAAQPRRKISLPPEFIEALNSEAGLAAPHQRDEEQCRAVRTALAGHFTFITGGPGTGKTTVLAKLLLQELVSQPELSIVLCAPTGKGQARIVDSLREELARLEPLCTEHGVPEELLEKLRSPECGTVDSLVLKFSREKLPYDLLVMDEGSMASLTLMAKFFSLLRPSARILICGDRNQLPSVEAGVVLGELYRAGRPGGPLSGRIVEFSRNYRAQSAPAIVGFSEAIKDLYQPESAESGADALARRMLSADTEDFTGYAWKNGAAAAQLQRECLPEIAAHFRSLVELAQNQPATEENLAKAFRMLDDFKVLCALRRGPFGIEEINRSVMSLLGLTSPDAPGIPLIINQNDHGLTRLKNGECGIVFRWDAEDNENPMAYFPRERSAAAFSIFQLPAHEPAFAMTVHKSQGSGYGRVVVILPGEESKVLSRELLYTAITRARRRVELWADHQRLLDCLNNPVERHSGLLEKLKKCSSEWLLNEKY